MNLFKPQLAGARPIDRMIAGLGAVTMDMYLVNINQERLISRYHFEETQESLTSNLLDLGKFVERSGKWLSARDLAAEGMRRGVKELGL